jgi:CysZ protein
MLIEGRDYPFDMKQFMKDIWRGIRLALRNTFWQLV